MKYYGENKIVSDVYLKRLQKLLKKCDHPWPLNLLRESTPHGRRLLFNYAKHKLAVEKFGIV